MSPRTVVFVVGPSVSGPSGFQHPVYFVSSSLRPIRCGSLRESVVFLLSCPNTACPSSGLRAFRRTVPIGRFRLFLRLLSGFPGFCLRALSGLVLCLRTLALRPSTAPDLFRPLLRSDPFGAFRLLFSGPLRRHGLRISAGRLRRFPVFILFRCGILRDPFVGPVIRFETRMSGSLRILS